MANVSKHLKDLNGNRVYPKTIFSNVFKNENENITLTTELQKKFDAYAFAGYEEGGSHIVESDYAVFQECSKGSYIYDLRTGGLYEVTTTVPQGSLWTSSVIEIHLGDEISSLNSDLASLNVSYDLRSLVQRVSTSTTINTIYGYRYGKHVKIYALVTLGAAKTDADGILIIDPNYIPSSDSSRYVGIVQIYSNNAWENPAWPLWMKKMTFGSTEYTTFGQGVTGTVSAGSKMILDIDFYIQ